LTVDGFWGFSDSYVLHFMAEYLVSLWPWPFIFWAVLITSLQCVHVLKETFVLRSHFLIFLFMSDKQRDKVIIITIDIIVLKVVHMHWYQPQTFCVIIIFIIIVTAIMKVCKMWLKLGDDVVVVCFLSAKVAFLKFLIYITVRFIGQ